MSGANRCGATQISTIRSSSQASKLPFRLAATPDVIPMQLPQPLTSTTGVSLRTSTSRRLKLSSACCRILRVVPAMVPAAGCPLACGWLSSVCLLGPALPAFLRATPPSHCSQPADPLQAAHFSSNWTRMEGVAFSRETRT